MGANLRWHLLCASLSLIHRTGPCSDFLYFNLIHISAYYDLSGQQTCHIPFSSFICSFVFDYFLDSMMSWHLFCVPYSITNNLCHSVFPSSVLCSSSILHHFITLSPLIPIFCLLSLIPLVPSSNFWLLVPFVLFLSLSSWHPFISPCLLIPTLTTYYSVPCESVSHFLHSPYYPIHCITLSPVV